MKFAHNGTLRIAYESQGGGPPLVLVHANPFDHRLWLYQVAHYAESHKIVNVDLRGYGLSDKPESPFSLRDMADDVLAATSTEGIGRAVFMGASVGANIALLIGLDNPERTAGLVLVGGGASSSPRFPERVAGYQSGDVAGYQLEHLRQLVAPAFFESELGAWLVRLFNERAPHLSGASIAQIFRALMAFDVTDRLPSLQPPTLIVNGDLDMALPNSREVAEKVPGARHVILPGTGHACCLEDPTAFAAAVTPFLNELREGASGWRR
jgi:pimeloyl-ACP methyl ester carboxylesterase